MPGLGLLVLLLQAGLRGCEVAAACRFRVVRLLLDARFRVVRLLLQAGLRVSEATGVCRFRVVGVAAASRFKGL